MHDPQSTFDPDLAEMSKGEWLNQLAGAAKEYGFFQPLGRSHFAALVRGGDTLLVTFETVQGIRALSGNAEPLGWSFVRTQGWSHLCIASDGDTWFRDKYVIALFDSMSDDGFFDDFETVLFYGAGPCGYAAAAFSIASPGATVVAIQPQATLDPRVAEWDDRFFEKRRMDFTSRYGYAPDMLDGCDHAFVLYDPMEQFDAMHAALFTRTGVTQLRLRNMGDAIQGDLMQMQVLVPLLEHAATGALDERTFASLYRARRTYSPYLRRVMMTLDVAERDELSYLLARNVTARMKAPRFQRRLEKLEAARENQNDTNDEG